MNVVVLIGARAGTVQDMAVETARAMVADGRARWPEGSPFAPPPPDPVPDATGSTGNTGSAGASSATPTTHAREKQRGRR